MYTLELIGFLNFKRITCKTIDEARKEYVKAKDEIYDASTNYWENRPCHWTSWKLYQDGTPSKEGTFNR